MHLNIKNDEAHKLATELAELTGESLTSARSGRRTNWPGDSSTNA